MKVKMLGFQIELAKGVSIGDLYQQIEAVEDTEIELKNRKSVLYTDVIDNLICGLVLSYKSNKKSLVTERDKDGDLKVIKNSLKKNEHGTEVSLFVINPSSLKGIFYSYNGSISPNGFSDLLKKRHNVAFNYKKDSYRKELTEFNTKKIDNISKKVLAKYSGVFSFSLLSTPADLDKVLSMYSEVSKITLRSTNALSDAGRYTPLGGISKNSSVIVDFEKGTLFKNIKDYVLDAFKPFAKKQEETALRIIGLSHTGEDLTLKVGDNVSNFGHLDYDDYVDILPMYKWKEYNKCEALKKIKQKLLEHRVVFGDISADDDWKFLSAKDVKSNSEGVIAVAVA